MKHMNYICLTRIEHDIHAKSYAKTMIDFDSLSPFTRVCVYKLKFWLPKILLMIFVRYFQHKKNEEGERSEWKRQVKWTFIPCSMLNALTNVQYAFAAPFCHCLGCRGFLDFVDLLHIFMLECAHTHTLNTVWIFL